MRTVYAIVLLLFLAVVFLFAIQNTQPETVKFAGWAMTAPMAMLVVGVYVLGMLSGATVVGLINRLLRRVTVRERH
jgi:putative membrane protein